MGKAGCNIIKVYTQGKAFKYQLIVDMCMGYESFVDFIICMTHWLVVTECQIFMIIFNILVKAVSINSSFLSSLLGMGVQINALYYTTY